MLFYKFTSSNNKQRSQEAYNALGDEEYYSLYTEDEYFKNGENKKIKNKEMEMDFQKQKKIFKEDFSKNEKSNIPLKFQEEKNQNNIFPLKNDYYQNKKNILQKKSELFPSKTPINLEESKLQITKNPKKDSAKAFNQFYSIDQYANYTVEKIDLSDEELKNKNYPNQLSKKIDFLLEKAKQTRINEDLEEYLEKKVDKITDILSSPKNEKNIYSLKKREIQKASLRRKKNAFIISIVTILLTSGTTIYFLKEGKNEVHNIYVA